MAVVNAHSALGPNLAPQDISIVKVTKDLAENAQLDPTAKRIATKSKKKSALKKLIVAEKEVRLEDSGLAPHAAVNASRPAEQAEVNLGIFAPDAPEFIPIGWVSNAVVAEAMAETSLEADGAKASQPSTGSRGEQRSRKDEERRKGSAAAMKAPEFVPSWCQQPEPNIDGADLHNTSETNDFMTDAFAEDGELAVSKAIERISAQAKEERSKGGQAKKEKKPPQVSNLEVRHYVRQVLSDELDEKVKAMLGDLARFQERTKERDPQKFAKLKRFCVGMSEATRSVKRDKCKCLIMAPNLDRSEADGGLDDTVEDLMDLCFEHEVPIIFALSRNRMGKAIGKNIRMSIVCVLSAEGVHQEFRQIVKMAEELRRQWVMRRMALGAQEVMAQIEAGAEPPADEAGTSASADSINERVLRHLEEQRLADERRRAEEKAQRDALKSVEKERKAAERRVKQEEKRAELREQQAAEAKKEEEEEKLKEEAEAERRRVAAIKEAGRQELIEKARQEKERRAEEERRRIAEQDAKAAAAAGIGDEDSSDDEGLPAGFNADFF